MMAKGDQLTSGKPLVGIMSVRGNCRLAYATTARVFPNPFPSRIAFGKFIIERWFRFFFFFFRLVRLLPLEVV
jgi:hypothetical protein